MGKSVTTEILLKEFARLAFSQRWNRCSKCGRRLKYQPGSIVLPLPGPNRFRTCRSCGFDNPSLTNQVMESLQNQGYDVQNFENVSPMPECFSCAQELLISKDFTKVFCCRCGGEWDRFAIEDIFGYPLSPQLAGFIPFQPDDSTEAKELDFLISQSGIDSGTAYKVARVVTSDEVNQNQSSALSSFATEVKDGLIAQWTAPIRLVKKITRKESIEEVVNKAEAQYISVYEDCISHYLWNGQSLQVSEVPYSDIFSDPQVPLTIPFQVSIEGQKQYKEFMDYWAQFWVIYRSNLEPYKERVFGEKARLQQEKLSREEVPSNQTQGNLAMELEKLAELHAKGILTDEEFAKAKNRLLS